MKSNGCRDVQYTGLQSTQTRRNTGKQGAQTRGTRLAHLPKHPYISGCIIIVGYANQFKFTQKIEKVTWLLAGAHNEKERPTQYICSIPTYDQNPLKFLSGKVHVWKSKPSP